MKALLFVALATALVPAASHAGVPAAPRATAAGPATLAALTQQFTEALKQRDLAKATACLAATCAYWLTQRPW